MPADKDLIPTALSISTTPASYAEVQKKAAKALWNGAKLKWPTLGCAANLSALLQEAGIPVPTVLGAGALAHKLGGAHGSRGWEHVAVGHQQPGDVGVTFDTGGNAGADHVYFVVSCKGTDEMIIADNQAPKPHTRFASGKAAPGGKKTTPTDYFLRAPGVPAPVDSTPAPAVVPAISLAAENAGPAAGKVLWVVNYDKLADFVDLARAVKATAVAVRTDNDVAAAITAFHKVNIKVIGWRWPSARRDAAMKEADKAVTLFGQGMDGYYADPEGEKGKPYDWDQPGLGKLAEEFCARITSAAGGKPFGTTSHYRAHKVFGDLPWAAFFKYSTVLLPQAYWRVPGGVIGHGDPADNFRVSLDCWEQAGGKRSLIVPMAGELGSAKAEEIKAYAAEAARQGIRELHFYAAEKGVSKAVWEAVRNA